MPIVRMRRTPASRAAWTSSASGAGPRSRWVWLSITAAPLTRSSLGSLGLGEERRRLLHPGPARSSAEGGAFERQVVGVERAQELLRRLGDVGCEQDGDDPEALGERAERRLELGGLGLVLGELPRRALLDVAVEAPHALPDALERLRDLGAVEQLLDLLAQALEVGGQRGVDVDVRDRPAAVD